MITATLPPDRPWQPAPALSRTLRLALALSIGAHGLALLGHYGLLPTLPDTPPTLQVELRLPPPVAPAPGPHACRPIPITPKAPPPVTSGWVLAPRTGDLERAHDRPPSWAGCETPVTMTGSLDRDRPGTDEEARDLRERLLRRREADALHVVAAELGQPLEERREVRREFRAEEPLVMRPRAEPRPQRAAERHGGGDRQRVGYERGSSKSSASQASSWRCCLTARSTPQL